MTYDVTVDGEPFRVSLVRAADGKWQCAVNGVAREIDVQLPESGVLSLLLGGRAYEVRREGSEELFLRGQRYEVEVRDPRALRSRRARADAASGPRSVVAPMPGKVIRIVAPVGTEVVAGQALLVIEAMKMQNELKAPKAGTVRKIVAAEGAAVNAGDVLAVVE